MEFRSTENVSVYVLNETEGLNYLLNCENSSWNRSTFTHHLAKCWLNTSYIFDDNLTYQHFKNDWGVENITTITEQPDGSNKTVYSVSFYFLVVNEYSNTTQFSLKWNTPNLVVEGLNETFENLVFIVLFIVGFSLLIRNKAERKRTYTNFGLGLIMGGVAPLLWRIYQYWRASDARVSWYNLFSFQEMPTNILGFAGNVLSFVSFICLGAALLFMSYTLERDIQKRKIPILTYLLVIMEVAIIGFALLLKVTLAVQGVFVIIIYAWIGVLVLVGANIAVAYIRLAAVSTGAVRRKAVIIVISVLGTYLSIVLREYLRPLFVPNLMACMFALIMYKALTMT